MSEPTMSPEQAQAAARELIAQQAAQAGGDPSAAGIYGDVAGRADQAPPQSQADLAGNLAAAGGRPTQVDVDALYAQMQEQQKHLAALIEQAQAAVPEPAAPPKPLTVPEIVGANAPGWLVHAAEYIEERVGRLEENGVIDRVEALERVVARLI